MDASPSLNPQYKRRETTHVMQVEVDQHEADMEVADHQVEGEEQLAPVLVKREKSGDGLHGQNVEDVRAQLVARGNDQNRKGPDHNRVKKDEEGHEVVRSRLVAPHGGPRDDFYAAIPPVEAKKAFFAHVAGTEVELIFVEMRKAHVSARCDEEGLNCQKDLEGITDFPAMSAFLNTFGSRLWSCFFPRKFRCPLFESRKRSV